MNDSLVYKLPYGIGAVVGALAGLPVVWQTILGLMAADFVMGTCGALIQDRFRFCEMKDGFIRKLMVLIVIGASAWLARGLGKEYGFDPSVAVTVVGGAYCVYEFLSITRNAHHAKLPIPKWLIDKLTVVQREFPLADFLHHEPDAQAESSSDPEVR